MAGLEAIRRDPQGQQRVAVEAVGAFLFVERITVEDLVRGIIVLSGNDACVVIAEALSPDGTEGGFARLMTRRAQEMGMTN
ncbi:MAG: D-alanyl-D-alanine carboxypeptidase, partial [Pseudomonadota bacterium]